MHEVLNTLYVLTQGSYLRLDHETIRIDIQGGPPRQVPLHHLGAIVVFGNVLLSPFLLHRCGEDGRGVVLLSKAGRFQARLEGPVSGNVLLRRAQHAALDHPGMACDIARRIVAGKVQNARQAVLRGAREAEEDAARAALTTAAANLAATLRALPLAADLDAVRGFEGRAGRDYFAAVPGLVRQQRSDFTFAGRNRRPPRDRMNALMSFLYALLLNDCRSALEAAGLDPQIGFLHGLRPGRAGLALDLMEEFRVPLADRVALACVNRRQLAHRDFEARPGGAVHLNERGRKTVVAAFQARKQDEVGHPAYKGKLAWGMVPFVQARLLARHLRGDLDRYTPFMPR